MDSVTTLSHDHPVTLEEFERIRDVDDGQRYELIDGVVVVTPAPVVRHQLAVVRLWRALDAAAPGSLHALVAPLDVVLSRSTLVQPDVLVAAKSDFTEGNLPGAPLLAVEVLSPSTRRRDLSVKREAYRRAGCASYWVVDPDGPALTAWELREGEYVQVAHATGEETAALTRPCAIRVRPADLVRD